MEMIKHEWIWSEVVSSDRVVLHLSGKTFWEVEEIAGTPWPKGIRFDGMTVMLEGQASQWIYAYCAIKVVELGAEKIIIFQPQLSDSVCIYPINGGVSGCNWFSADRIEPDGIWLELISPPVDELWEKGVLSDLPDLFASEKFIGIRTITITGQASIWMAVAVAVNVWVKGIKQVKLFAPRNNVSIQVSPELKRTNEKPVTRKVAGTVIGVVGDPNSGKSVFSHLLYKACRESGLQVWRYDCDAASSTPDWYMQMRRQCRDKEAKELRVGNKRQWTAELEAGTALTIDYLKRYYGLIIADVAGGIHKEGEPSEAAQRIPPGRELIMRQIDAFIVLSLPERDSGKWWRRDLALHRMDGKIVAELVTTSPERPLSLVLEDNSTDSILHGRITGLQRDAVLNGTILQPLLDGLKKKF